MEIVRCPHSNPVGVATVGYLHSNPVEVVIMAHNLESWVSEVGLQHCCLYERCECGAYDQPDFEIALNSHGYAGDRQILRGGWAASEVGWIRPHTQLGESRGYWKKKDDRTIPFRKMEVSNSC
jgi:hypothetical protein